MRTICTLDAKLGRRQVKKNEEWPTPMAIDHAIGLVVGFTRMKTYE